ncbi:MAG: DNA helicase RecQ [Lentimicrobiaceae bacterium]|nr:DNA helicase RecQ [Lentimicrobiaceae bacterium]
MKNYKNYPLAKDLKAIFGFDSFKGDQEAVIRNVLSGKDTFVIMPTGGGKSMCFQLPAMILPGTAIIISPLISLMKNQVDAIRQFGAEPGVAHFLNSSLNKSEISQVKNDLVSGKTKLLYVAPESLTKEDNILFFRDIKISFYAIDEAHCISEWGHDFRPEYRRIRPIIEEIGHKVPIMALTATATPKVQQDILKNLGMQEASLFKSSFDRANLYYEVRYKDNNINKELIRFIREHHGKSGIIYCLSRKSVEDLADMLVANGIKALPYHAGLESSVRVANQDKFLMEEVDVIVATIAFGMGIDKPDVRYVIHYDMPKSLEGYYQETGRSGRDDGEGICLAFYSYKDIEKLEKFSKNKGVAEQEISHLLLVEVVSYAESAMCRRKQLLHYFGEAYDKDNCGNCDNCLNPKSQIDGIEYIELALETILATKELCKAKHLVNILIGKMSSNIKTYKHHKLEMFGKGMGNSERFWDGVVRQMLVEELITKDVENYGILKVTPAGHKYLKTPYSIMVTEDTLEDDGDSDNIIGAGGGSSGSTDKVLFSMLKDLRKNIAKKENIPPFVIFQDPSLEDMTIQYPITMEEMQQITGVGQGKAQKYAQPFLDLISSYVKENDITRPMDLVVKTVANKSGQKIYIIQNIDRRKSLDDIATAKNLSLDELLTEIESIVDSGTKIDISYYINEVIDPYHQEEIIEYFQNATSDSVQEAHVALGENEFTEEEIRLMRIKYISEIGN